MQYNDLLFIQDYQLVFITYLP